MCLADRIKATGGTNRAALQKLAETVVLTSQGVPFIWCGDEIMRDRKGVHNCFASPDSINAISWKNKTKYRDVFDYVKNIIAIRKAHKAFRMGTAEAVRQNLTFLPAKQDNVIAYQLNGKAVGDSWGTIIVVFNSNTKAIKQAVPKGNYTVVVKDGKADANGLGTSKGGNITIPAQSALIMYK